MITPESIDFKSRIKLFLYRTFFIPIKVFNIRHKKQIDVVFIISELGVWKTESLYLEMLKHPKFSPHIAVVESTEDSNAKEITLNYIKKKGYEFADIKKEDFIYDYYKADIIFYQKPYYWVIPDNQRIGHNYKSLFCFVTYGLSTIKEKWAINQQVQLYSWMNFQFNESSSKELSKISLIKGKNFVVTGFPMTDSYLKSAVNCPWKKIDDGKNRKKIIWAPHHTISDKQGWLNYSTFLSYSDIMFAIAKEHEDEIQIAFKPHPLLKTKLDSIWGIEKADKYYEEWANLYNGQLCLGEYVDLFLTSDAMIHDCSSFMIEYMYTGNPVLFLENGIQHEDNMLENARLAYEAHYKANNSNDIELFISNLINEIDIKKEERSIYKRERLLPSKGQTACTNIIKSILGEQ